MQDISYTGEFSYEIGFVIPHAYYLFKNGLLRKSISSKGTRPYWFFSPKHIEKWKKRQDPGTRPIPGDNQSLYTNKMDFSQWILPPYKYHYENTLFRYDKPIFIIHNKHSGQGHKPQKLTKDYIPVPQLKQIFDLLVEHFQVIYIRPTGQESGYSNDKNEILAFNDLEVIENEYPDILTMQYFIKRYPGLDYNLMQLMIHANAEYSMSASSGATILACLFGGLHIVCEISNNYLYTNGAFDTIVPQMSGTDVRAVNNYSSLINEVKKVVDEYTAK